jgi:hypothetical protein
VVETENSANGKLEKRMMAPNDAAQRIQAIRTGFPKEHIPDGLVEGALTAIVAAKRQTLEGQNEFLKTNQNLNVQDLAQEIEQEIIQARKEDPLLDEEMARVEHASR